MMKCSRCKHEWDYKGKCEYYITCPSCYTKIRIKKDKKEFKNQANEIKERKINERE